MISLKHKAWIVLILLIAAAFRVVGVVDVSPPGLEHDEVANWLIDRAILDEGKRGVYFEEAYGHEAGFHYVQAASVALLGDHALALRFPAMMAGLLLVAVSFALGRKLFGVEVAIVAMGFSAVIFWPIFYSRLGLRAISLPLLAGLSLYFFWTAWERGGERNAGLRGGIAEGRGVGEIGFFVLAGVFAGLTIYTYMAARAVPIFFVAWIGYLALFQWGQFKQKGRGVALFVLVASAVALPMFLYLQTNPGAEFRISEVDAPLRALLVGDFGPVLGNFVKIAGMFGFSGDPLWRQNVASRPVFDPITALLFYAGVALAVWRWRDARYAFLLIWMGAAAIPSLVTVDAPSSIRLINMLITVTLFPAIVINIIPRLSTAIPKLSTAIPYLLAGTLVLAHIWWTTGALFHSWPENDEVRFVWQASLTEMGAFLDADVGNDPTAIGGWSPATMDPPTMFLSMGRDDVALRYFGSDSMTAPITTIIIPGLDSADHVRLMHPDIRTLAPDLEAALVGWSGGSRPIESFILYDIPTPIELMPQHAESALFGGQLELLGSSYFADSATFLTYWRVVAPTAEARRFFLHAVDADGKLISQHDGNDAPAMHWQTGDLIVQAHFLPDMNGATAVRLGVYDPSNGARLTTESGADFVEIGNNQ